MTTILLRGGRVHTPADPEATAVAITDGHISWIGGEHGLTAAGGADHVIDLDGLLVVPGFVDAHVHATDTGLGLIGLDLIGVGSRSELLDRVRAAAGSTDAGVLWAHGWDETLWSDRTLPTTTELDAAVGNRPAYIARRDVHSALASTALRAAAGTDLAGRDGFDPQLPLVADAHHAVRNTAKSLLTPAQRTSAHHHFLEHAASHGIVEVHECGFGDPAGLADLRMLMDATGPVRVRGLLGEVARDSDHARLLLAESGADALAGDLVVDGAIGSRTAALCSDYLDLPGRGRRYLSDDQIRDHLVACARAGIQPGFHAIGDDAVAAVAAGLTRAAEILGGTVHLAAVTPRIEHAEMIGPEQIAAFAAVGAVASVQPVFDELWGGDGMYVERLGTQRAGTMNPFAAMAAAGVPLALGSDAPVTPIDPWRAVRAAVHHRTAGSGLSPRAAFVAHTRGGHRAAGRMDRGVGTVTVGAPADLALVRAGELVRPAPDVVVARWSTDPRSRVPLLPDLSPGADLPTTIATFAEGRVVHDPQGLFAAVVG